MRTDRRQPDFWTRSLHAASALLLALSFGLSGCNEIRVYDLVDPDSPSQVRLTGVFGQLEQVGGSAPRPAPYTRFAVSDGFELRGFVRGVMRWGQVGDLGDGLIIRPKLRLSGSDFSGLEGAPDPASLRFAVLDLDPESVRAALAEHTNDRFARRFMEGEATSWLRVLQRQDFADRRLLGRPAGESLRVTAFIGDDPATPESYVDPLPYLLAAAPESVRAALDPQPPVISRVSIGREFDGAAADVFTPPPAHWREVAEFDRPLTRNDDMPFLALAVRVDLSDRAAADSPSLGVHEVAWRLYETSDPLAGGDRRRTLIRTGRRRFGRIRASDMAALSTAEGLSHYFDLAESDVDAGRTSLILRFDDADWGADADPGEVREFLSQPVGGLSNRDYSSNFLDILSSASEFMELEIAVRDAANPVATTRSIFFETGSDVVRIVGVRGGATPEGEYAFGLTSTGGHETVRDDAIDDAYSSAVNAALLPTTATPLQDGEDRTYRSDDGRFLLGDVVNRGGASSGPDYLIAWHALHPPTLISPRTWRVDGVDPPVVIQVDQPITVRLVAHIIAFEEYRFVPRPPTGRARTLANATAWLKAQVAMANDLFARQRLGVSVSLANSDILDRTSPAALTGVPTAGRAAAHDRLANRGFNQPLSAFPNLVPSVAGAINLYLINYDPNAGALARTGLGAITTSDRLFAPIIMSNRLRPDGTTLAHELGHRMTLLHLGTTARPPVSNEWIAVRKTPNMCANLMSNNDNCMFDRVRTDLSEGQIFRMHFDRNSVLNRQNVSGGAQSHRNAAAPPGAAPRPTVTCGAGIGDGCPSELYWIEWEK